MKDKRGKELLSYSDFLSVFYNARERSEKKKIPLVAGFMEHGLNKYKHWFFKMCDRWNLKTLTEVIAFDTWVRNYDGVS